MKMYLLFRFFWGEKKGNSSCKIFRAERLVHCEKIYVGMCRRLKDAWSSLYYTIPRNDWNKNFVATSFM
jgi:hypothetical protein